MMRDPLDVEEELRAFSGVAFSLAASGLRLWPHESDLLSLRHDAPQEVGAAIETCRGFVIVPSTTDAELGDGRFATLARVIAQRVEEGRVLLVVRGLCRVELSKHYPLPFDSELIAARPMLDREPAAPTIHRENRRLEILEAAAALVPGPVPLSVSSFFLDRVSLGGLCDLLADLANDETELCGEANVDLRSDAVLAGLRQQVRLRRQTPPADSLLPPFSTN